MGHGAVSGPPSGSGPGALPLALGVKNGRVVLEVSDHRVAPGAVLRALQLEVPDVVFPVDMTGGPRAFQSRATVLRRLQLELDPARGHPAIRSRLELAGVDLQGVRLFGRRGLLQVSARVQRVPVVATFALTPDGGSGVRLTPGPAHAFGPLPRGTPPLFVLILQAVKAALASLRPHVEDAQMVCVPVAEAALWAVLPTAGWKLPANRRLPVHEVTVDRAGRVQVTVGAPEEAEDDLDSEGALPTMSVLARAAEAPAAIQDAYRRLEQGDPIAAFTGLRAHLDPATGPVSVVDTLLQIGVSDPRLHADAVDLAIDALSRAPGDPAGLLALAAMREDEHRDAARRESGQRYEAAARSFRATDDVLAAAYAHLAAARVLSPIDPGDAARHVNTALRLAPSDDLVQLASIDALTYEARLSEALATARQLAVHAGDASLKVAAALAAGALCAGPLHDLAGAKRAYELALREDPGCEEAIEGLARAVLEKGDPRRAAALLERLLKGSAKVDAARASGLAVALGDAFRDLAPHAAVQRYQEARRLDPSNTEALERIAEVSEGAADLEGSLEALEAMLVRRSKIEDAGRESELRLRAADLCEATRRLQRATEHLELALETADDAEPILERLTELYREVDRPHAVDRALARQVEHARGRADAPKIVQLARQRRDVLAQLGAPLTPVIDDLLAAEALAPGRDGEVRELLTELTDLEDQPDVAARTLERRVAAQDATQVDAGRFEVLAGLWRRAGDHDAANVALRKAVTLDPSRPQALVQLLEAPDAYEDADSLLEVVSAAVATQEDPERRADLQVSQVRLLTALGRTRDAFRLARTLVDARPDLLDVTISLALELERFEVAETLAQRRVESMDGASAAARLGALVELSDAAAGQGDHVAAERALTTALEECEQPGVDPATMVDVVGRLRRLYTDHEQLEELAELELSCAEREASTLPERVERYCEAVAALQRSDQGRRASAVLMQALLHVESGLPTETPATLLSRLEGLATALREHRVLARIHDIHARGSEDPRERLRHRVRQLEALDDAGLPQDAAALIPDLDLARISQIPALERVASVATRAGDPATAARFFAAAAAAARSTRNVDRAVDLHAKAIEAHGEAGDTSGRLRHHRALLELAPHDDPRVESSLKEIEDAARTSGDLQSLTWSLEGLAGQIAEPAARAETLLEAAAYRLQELDDLGAARTLIDEAHALAPTDERISRFRLEILRSSGDLDELTRMLTDLAFSTESEAEAGALLLEAATVLCERDDLTPADAERALELARRAAGHLEDPEPALRRVVTLAKRLEKSQDELLALNRLLACVDEPVEQYRLRLRRVALFQDVRHDPERAEQELRAAIEVYDHAGGFGPEEIALETALLAALTITSQSQAWDEHVRYLERLIDCTDSHEERAELLSKLGEVLEWKLGDGAAAERSYLAALAAKPRYTRAWDALESLYRAGKRFGDLADNLGVELLQNTWARLVREGPQAEAVACAEALWPRLPVASAQRADVLIALADLYRSFRDEAEGAVLALEQVVRDAPGAHRDAALERLGVLFLEEERWELYVDVLRRQAERSTDAHHRAHRLAELGSVFEWRLGDGAAAEREYRAALAADPDCVDALEGLTLLLASQDRFAELGQDVGMDTLRSKTRQLLGRGGRDSARAVKAAQEVAKVLPIEERGSWWCKVGELAQRREERRIAWERASSFDGPHRVRALRSLNELLEDAGDEVARANVLRKLLDHAASTPEERAGLNLDLGQMLWRLAREADGPARHAIQDEARRALAEVLRVDPENAVAGEVLTAMGNLEGASGADAVSVIRSALLDDPRQPLLVEALAKIMLVRNDDLGALGPIAITRHLDSGATMPAREPPVPSRQLSDGVCRDLLSQGRLHGGLAELMSWAALPLAAAIGTMRRDGDEDRRQWVPLEGPHRVLPEHVRRALIDVRRVSGVPYVVKTDDGTDVEICVEPRDPPLLCLQDAFVRRVEPTALRFRLGRMMMRLRLGDLSVYPGISRSELRAWTELLLNIAEEDVADRVSYEVADVIGPLHAVLGDSRLGVLRRLAERARADGGDHAEWSEAVQQTAVHFGHLLCGDLGVAISELERDGPERADPLLKFLLSPAYRDALEVASSRLA